MPSLLASVRREDGYDRVELAVRSLEEEWRYGEPRRGLQQYWAEHDPDGTTSVLAALVKADLRCRFVRGGRPEVQGYLERFPVLCAEKDRVLSLIYEEFCLREEHGEHPQPDSFCERYAPWRDSLASQLKYHQLLSRVVGPPSTPPRFPEPGEHFQQFALDSVLGQGGAARVYRARDGRLGGRQVALKVSPDRGHEPSIMGRLDHEHIVPVHSVVVEPETQLRGLIMPYRPGLPLDEVIKRVNPSSRPDSARVLWDVVAVSAKSDAPGPAGEIHPGWSGFPIHGTYAQGVAWLISTLARAVAHAHAREVHHRDIKPPNVLLTLSNGPQLFDFNLAHDPHAAEQAVAALRGGTLPYMAPEQLEAFIDPARWDTVGAAADLYSVGLVMYELLTGQAPDVPEQSLPLPRAIRSLLDRRSLQRFAPRLVNPSIPHALEAITLRCLAYSDKDRYPSALALAEDLDRFLQDKDLVHARNPSRKERLKIWSRRNWAILVGAGLAAAVAVAFTAQELTPVELRPQFRAAVKAVDESDHARALELLDPLVSQYPGSPLIQLYGSVACAQNDQIPKAARLFRQASELPKAVAIFDDWAKTHPAFIHNYEILGVKLFDGPTTGPKKKLPITYPEQARKAIDAALRMGSTDADVLIRDALFDENSENYKAAVLKLTRIIDRVNREPAADRDLILAKLNCYLYRARILIHQGDRQRSSRSGTALQAAESSYRRAVEDVMRGVALVPIARTRERFRYDILRILAELGFGELAALRDNAEEARKSASQATALLDSYNKFDNEEGFQNLRKEVLAFQHRLDAKLGTSLSTAP